MLSIVCRALKKRGNLWKFYFEYVFIKFTFVISLGFNAFLVNIESRLAYTFGCAAA